MKNPIETILITGARAPIALELARSFYNHGHKVIMADSQHLTIARWSNSVAKYFVISSPRHNTNLFIKDIQRIIQNEHVTHFIPTCEEAIYVSAHKDNFKCKVWTCDKDLILSLHNKFSFSNYNNNPFPVPKTSLVSDFRDWENSLQYVFKPCYSRFASSVIIHKKIDSQYFKEEDKEKWIAQNKIDGLEICTYSIWDHGQLKAYAAYHPLFKAGKGAGVYFEPIKNDLIYGYVKEIGKHIQYTGQLCFDVIIDKFQIPYFIECNPRGTSGAHLIGDQLAEAFLGNSTYIYEDKQEFSIKYAMAILHFKSFFKKRVRNSKDIIFRSNDLKPFFLQIFSLIEITFLKLTKRISWLEATTGDIEWNSDEM